ncbi:MAG: phosphatidylinositol-specific phospholipase C/glycerophosphodiester phosphodiesterase family protein [Candidatus Sumerlaeaceae bacterium]
MLKPGQTFRICVYVLVLGNSPTGTSGDSAGTTSVLTRAHAHNDYEHTRPLFDALDHGFASVEADVHFVDGNLLVAHERKDARADRSLRSLYLDPLQKRVRDNGGYVFRESSQSLLLLIDIKADGEGTWSELQRLLGSYRNMLTSFGDQPEVGSVTIVLTGNRPDLASFGSKPLRYAAMDGRLNEMSTTVPVSLMPLVSAAWKDHFTWQGTGPMPTLEQQELQRIVEQVHAQGRALRFWGAPDNPAMWRELTNAGIDHLNTDDLAGMRRFLTSDPHQADQHSRR